MRPSDGEMQKLRAYLDNGTCKAAADALGISEQAVKQALFRLRLKARVESTPQLLFLYHDELKKMGPVL